MTAASASFQQNVDAAFQFLMNKDTLNAPIEEKIEFLEKKGLSKEEISTALEKTKHVNYLPNTIKAGPAVLTWKDWLVAAAVIGSAGYYGFKALSSYLGPYWPFYQATDKEAIEDMPIVEALEKESELDIEYLKEACETIDAIAEQSAGTLAEITKSQEQLNLSCDNMSAALQLYQQNMSFVSPALGKFDSSNTGDIELIASEVEQLRKMIPKLMQNSLTNYDATLKDLHRELKSLRSLMMVQQKSLTEVASPKQEIETPSTPKHELPAWQRT